jgi:hypothetical protein
MDATQRLLRAAVAEPTNQRFVLLCEASAMTAVMVMGCVSDILTPSSGRRSHCCPDDAARDKLGATGPMHAQSLCIANTWLVCNPHARQVNAVDCLQTIRVPSRLSFTALGAALMFLVRPVMSLDV